MKDIDDKILAAMQAETEQSLEEYSEELGICGLMGESFKGAFGWTLMLAIAMIFVFGGLTIYCGINFFHEKDIALKLNWLAAGFVSFIVFAILRLWFFMELNRLSIKREIKRGEIQISLLATRLESLLSR